MRIKQAIIPAILALSAAGSILVGSAVPAAAAPASSTVVVTASNPTMFVHNMFVHNLDNLHTANGLLLIQPIRGRPIV